MWDGLCRTLGREDLLENPNYADARSRLENKEGLWSELEPAFAARTAAEWADLLTENDVPNALVKTVPEALDDARHSGRGMIVEIDDGSGRKIEVVGGPIRMGAGVPVAPTYPPALGADAREVLAEWPELDATEIRTLIDDGIVKTGGANR